METFIKTWQLKKRMQHGGPLLLFTDGLTTKLGIECFRGDSGLI